MTEDAEVARLTELQVERDGWQQRTLLLDAELKEAQETIAALRSQLEGAVGALESLKWKSVDKDNMEFACRITCFQMDKIKAALANVREGKARRWP